MKLKDTLYDDCSKCFSLLIKMTVREYFELFANSFYKKGEIGGQRDTIKTTAALRVRKRMAEDIKKGAVLPAIVVGMIMEPEKMDSIREWNTENIQEEISRLKDSKMLIIDGIQRTSTLKLQYDNIENSEIRVEFWIANKLESLTYRMLVLNTGQIPWSLRRQMEVIFSVQIDEIITKIKSKFSSEINQVIIHKIDDSSHRKGAGEYQAKEIIELYLCFASRKNKIDTDSMLSEEFTKLDVIDAMANQKFFQDFIEVLACMCKLDFAIEKYIKDLSEENVKALNIFKGQTARVGFITAAAQKIYGRPGSIPRDEAYQTEAITKIINICDNITLKISSLKEEDGDEFFDFDTLQYNLANGPRSKIGDYQRDFYTETFRTFFHDDFDAYSMSTCWRSIY